VADARYIAYLTVDLCGEVKADEVQDYCHQACHTRKGVNLPKGADQSQDPTWATKPNSIAYNYRPILSSGKDDDLGWHSTRSQD
jgi:hypothetical protein